MKREGKRDLIAGADSGIGRATAILFAQDGADVAITDNTDAAGLAATFNLTARDLETRDLRPARRFCDGRDPMIGRRMSDLENGASSAARPA